MSAFFHNMFQSFFLLGYISLYVISIAILRPFRPHRFRKKSTVAIKISYLIYLAIFLSFTYLVLFGNNTETKGLEPGEHFFNDHFVLFLSATIVPNIGITIRRKVQKNRTQFNILFTLLNTLFIMYLSFLMVSKQWVLL
jgi:cytochrome c biogenesis factor